MDDSLKQRLFALELELPDPAKRASVARLSALPDEAFVERGASGRRIVRQALLQELPAAAGAVRERAFDPHAWLPAPDLAQLRCRSERRDGGGAPVRQALCSSLWALPRRQMAHAVPPGRADSRRRLSMGPWERQRSL